MLILGVETSCDDTAAAVLRDGRTILANVVSSQDQVHGPYGGVVPELASRQHIKTILPIVDGALQKANVRLQDLDGMAVTYGPEPGSPPLPLRGSESGDSPAERDEADLGSRP